MSNSLSRSRITAALASMWKPNTDGKLSTFSWGTLGLLKIAWTVRAYCVGLRRWIWRGPGVVHSLSGVPGGGMGGTEVGLGVTPGVTLGGTGFPLEST